MQINIFQDALRITWCDDNNCPKKAHCSRYKVGGNEKYLLVYYIKTPRKTDDSCGMYIRKLN